jgi:hypothetical protein
MQKACSSAIDQFVLSLNFDHTLVDGIGRTANSAGKNLKTVQTGRLQNYMLFALIGVIIILVFQIT